MNGQEILAFASMVRKKLMAKGLTRIGADVAEDLEQEVCLTIWETFQRSGVPLGPGTRAYYWTAAMRQVPVLMATKIMSPVHVPRYKLESGGLNEACEAGVALKPTHTKDAAATGSPADGIAADEAAQRRRRLRDSLRAQVAKMPGDRRPIARALAGLGRPKMSAGEAAFHFGVDFKIAKRVEIDLRQKLKGDRHARRAFRVYIEHEEAA